MILRYLIKTISFEIQHYLVKRITSEVHYDYLVKMINPTWNVVKPGTPEQRNTGTGKSGTVNPEHQKSGTPKSGTLKIRNTKIRNSKNPEQQKSGTPKSGTAKIRNSKKIRNNKKKFGTATIVNTKHMV